MSQPLAIAQHIVNAGHPFTVRQICAVFQDLTYKQIECACWRAFRAGWIKRERFDKRSIAYAPGVIDEASARVSVLQAQRRYVSLLRGQPAVVTKPVIPEGVPLGIPASVWDLPVHGWPAERTPTNYWPAEAEEMA